MIVAAGLTPAWQQILSFAEFRPGEVNRAVDVRWIASGKVLNVGCALHHLGAKSRTVSIFGGGTGRQMRREFDSLGTSTRWVETAAPTRVCTTILDRNANDSTELVENSAPISLDELAGFEQAFAEETGTADWIVLSGSLPQGAPPDIYRRLIETTSGRAILDVRGPELIACLPLRPFLVKPNRAELAHTIGQPIDSSAELHSAMQTLRRRGAQRVLVSNGCGELWFLGDGDLLTFRPPRVEAINPIGCGDCLAAGLAVAYSEGADDVAAIEFGMAAAADNARQLLSARLDRSRVNELVKQIHKVA